MAYTGRTPAAAPLTSGDIPDGSVTPNDLSTGAPSWDTSGNVTATGTVTTDGASLDGAVVINESGADVDFRIESDTNTHAFFLDGATGAVGIGTATASDMTATIYNTSSTSAGIQCQNSSTGTGTGNGFFVGIGGSGTAGTVGYIWNYENDRISFATNNTERMRIDSSGRVTMPYQPAFMAYATTNGQSGLINFAATHSNVGSHFSTSTNRFTAPVAGSYFFSWATVMSGSTFGSTIAIRKNGSTLTSTAVYTGNNDSSPQDYPSSTVCVVHYLNANDYVDVYANTSIQATYGAFVGYLIG